MFIINNFFCPSVLMPGGLIQIVNYGSQDLFLTGTPEITFFKVVYRRHTNFSIDSVRVDFDDAIGFGLTSSVDIPKIGDLVHKAYLEIILPKIDFKRIVSTTNNDLLLAFQSADADYEIFKSFASINRRAYASAVELIEADNTNSISNIVVQINNVFNEANNDSIITSIKEVMERKMNLPFGYNEISMQEIANPLINQNITKDDLFRELNIGIDKTVKTQKVLFSDYLSTRDANEDSMNTNIKFAWVDRIGHSIIDYIEIFIGGQRMDKHYGDWINIWYELTANRDMEEIYNKMIGNVSKLTTFDRNSKPLYKLTIPLEFWFSRFSGLALPLVSLEYHDVTFNLKLRNLEDVSYIERDQTIYISDSSTNIFLDEAVEELGININAKLLLDYIYLDSPERRRFAQASHEYLIEQIQRLEINDVNQLSLQCILNNFVHPSKELVWVAQKEAFTENFDGYTKLRWNNYSQTEEGKGNPIRSASMDFHSYRRVEEQNGNYFNYVQPYEAHGATPSDGINVYSFSIFPEEHQPSGSANLSRLSRVQLNINFNDDLFSSDNDTVCVRIYTRNINILRFVSGMAGLSYTYG